MTALYHTNARVSSVPYIFHEPHRKLRDNLYVPTHRQVTWNLGEKWIQRHGELSFMTTGEISQLKKKKKKLWRGKASRELLPNISFQMPTCCKKSFVQLSGFPRILLTIALPIPYTCFPVCDNEMDFSPKLLQVIDVTGCLLMLICALCKNCTNTD